VTGLRDWLEADILSLGMAADAARRRADAKPAVTYLRVQTFAAADLAGGAVVLEAAAEARLYDLPPALDEAVALVAMLRERAGTRRVAAYSMADLEERTTEGWGPLAGVLARLTAAGLSDVAELPVDKVVDLAASVRALTAAGIAPRRLTVSRALGDRKIDVLDEVRRCRQGSSRPPSFSPLPRHAPLDRPTTGYEDLRMVALARLALDASPSAAPSIEVDWTLYGPKLAQVALTFGADHLDAVPAMSDASLGPRRGAVEDVERNIRAAGFEPLEYRPA
jgi:hypothetical protein